MGWNICGAAINKNYENNLNELGQVLTGRNLRLGKRQGKTFGNVDKMQSTSGRLDVLFTESGTFAWCNLFETIDFIVRGRKDLQKDVSIIVFAVSETSMAFSFKYYENGVKIREVWENWDDNLNDYKRDMEGEPLPEEIKESDRTWAILAVVSRLIGRNFHDVGQEEPVTRYMFTL